MNNIVVRETTFREYKEFIKNIVDKCQLVYPKTISVLHEDNLIAIKYSQNVSINDIKEAVLSKENVCILNIDEFNSAVVTDSKEMKVVKVNKHYYEDKNFIITGVML